MSCVVSTGYMRGAPVPVVETDCVVVSPGKFQLFTPDTALGTEYSGTFTLNPGDAVLLDAYNMVEDKHIYVERVVRSSYCPPSGCNCDPVAMHNAAGIDGVIAFVEDMYVGGKRWALYKSSTDDTANVLQLLIALPGTYRLRLEDCSTQLGSLEVEGLAFKIKDVGHLPDVYFAGVA